MTRIGLKKLWRIQFSYTTAKGSAEGWTYTVYYDSTMSGNPNGSADLSDLSRVDFAIDPQNPNKILSAGFQNQAINRNAERINKKLNLSKTYDIRNVEFTNCGDRANQTIVFDSYGRPMGQVADSTVPYDRLFVGQNPCTITLTNNAGEHALITIQPETGYVNYTLASNTGPGGQ